jgi:hypothetical protein
MVGMDKRLKEQQRLLDVFRSTFGRLQTHCLTYAINLPSAPGVRWVRSEEVISILSQVAEGILNGNQGTLVLQEDEPTRPA